MMNFTKWIAAVWLAYSLLACASFFDEKSVTQILNSKERYHGTELVVSGVLVNTTSKLAICAPEKQDDCLNLEVTKELLNELKANAGAMVSVKGMYSDHEFENKDGQSTFYPSRLIVSEIHQ